MKIFDTLFKRKAKHRRTYKESPNREKYERIASDLRTNPQHVYEIAHGKSLLSYDDRVIKEQLYQAGLIKEDEEFEPEII